VGCLGRRLARAVHTCPRKRSDSDLVLISEHSLFTSIPQIKKGLTHVISTNCRFVLWIAPRFDCTGRIYGERD
jgi:hypothetical protein